MLALIVIVLFGLGFAYFSTLNTLTVHVNLFGTLLIVPLYGLVLGSILLGVVVSWILSLFDWAASAWTLRSRESKIKESEEDILGLRKRVYDLELENTRLRGERNPKEAIVIEEKPERKHISLADRIRHRLYS